MNVMKRNAPKILIAAGLILFLGAGFLWLRDRANDPQRVFYAMLRNNVTTSGVSRTVAQESSVQSLVQTTQTQTGEANVVAGRTELTQGDGRTETSVVTESIGTPNEDYIRYADVSTGQTGRSGQPLDFSSVVGQWGLSPASQSVTRGGELFGEATLGIVPFGKLSRGQSEALIRQIRELEVYNVDFSSVERSQVRGRPVYKYRAQIQPERYVQMLQLFGEYIGTDQLADLNPANFADDPAITIDFNVDVWSKQLTEANFVDSNRKENYAAYGAWREVMFPENTIPISELQRQLQRIQ